MRCHVIDAIAVFEVWITVTMALKVGDSFANETKKFPSVARRKDRPKGWRYCYRPLSACLEEVHGSRKASTYRDAHATVCWRWSTFQPVVLLVQFHNRHVNIVKSALDILADCVNVQQACRFHTALEIAYNWIFLKKIFIRRLKRKTFILVTS